MTPKRQATRREAIEKQIDENLRRVYSDEQPEQIPDKFIELLQKLREQE